MALDQDLHSDLIGQDEADARRVCEKAGVRFRVKRRDGKGLMGTADMDRGRLNVAIESGRVTEIIGYG